MVSTDSKRTQYVVSNAKLFFILNSESMEIGQEKTFKMRGVDLLKGMINIGRFSLTYGPLCIHTVWKTCKCRWEEGTLPLSPWVNAHIMLGT